MSEVVVGPDPIALVRTYLDPLMTPPIHGKVPNPRPTRFLRVSAAGGLGFVGKALYRARVTLEAWSENGDPQALKDLQDACAYLEAAVAFFAECTAPAYLPDPDSGVPRYVSTVELAAVGSVL